MRRFPKAVFLWLLVWGAMLTAAGTLIYLLLHLVCSCLFN